MNDFSTSIDDLEPFEFQARVLGMLPDAPLIDPEPDLLQYLLARPDEFRSPVRTLLTECDPAGDPPLGGYRAFHLIALLGQWRDEDGVEAIVRHLGTRWSWGWNELPHALTRIGPAAIRPLLFAAFRPELQPVARARALRALTSVAIAGREFSKEPHWQGAKARIDETISALRVFVSRADTEDALVVREAAAGLCHLRDVETWTEVLDLFATDAVSEDEHFDVRLADAFMHGKALRMDLGGWNVPSIRLPKPGR